MGSRPYSCICGTTTNVHDDECAMVFGGARPCDAQEIVELRAENMRLRAGIQRVIDSTCLGGGRPGDPCLDQHSVDCARTIAVAALAELLTKTVAL